MSPKKADASLPQVRLNDRRALKLARLTNVEVARLADQTLSDLRDHIIEIDPRLLYLQRICGRVVKKDPTTGDLSPVPFATVHVEDTDCHFFAYTPPGIPWTWLYPFHCHREEITSVTTDACGKFCVWVPRFDIDWILTWIRRFICYPIRPWIIDVLERLPLDFDPPLPDPDPLPYLLKARDRLPLVLEKQLGRGVAERLMSRVEGIARLGANAAPARALLQTPAFEAPPPPPLAPAALEEFKGQMETYLGGMGEQVPHRREMLAARAALPEASVPAGFVFDPQHFIGPFFMCKAIYLPVFKAIRDVPDITFRVTQDVDGDGDEELIYAESFFDVRWNSGSIPDVTLYAWQNAQEGVLCEVPPLECSTQAIERVGFYPVNVATYHNNVSGYAVRPNRPKPEPRGAATAPFSGTLHLFGCNNYPGAKFYRVRYHFTAHGSSTTVGPVSFLYSWLLHRNVPSFQTKVVTPDADGWYPIIPDSEGWWPEHLLLRWPATAAGRYEVELEFGNASKNIMHTVPPIRLYVDNSNVNLGFDRVEWREVGTTAWETLNEVCPVVKRTAGRDIQVRVTCTASAQHFRSVTLTPHGCGAGSFSLVSGDPDHWYTGAADNYWHEVVTYNLPGAAAEGSYRFSLHACTRAFTPNDVDEGGDPSVDWNYDPCWIDRYAQYIFSVIDKA
ncbi:MAG: hypothetical protein JW910_19305 [Anaerolineae bacterium]|nr:hypothetical protein [Anaerolineae bacterium]